MSIHQLNFRFVLAICVLGFLICGNSHAQDKIQVNSATPSSALQGTFDLNVEITGENFAKGAVVRFLRPGSDEDRGDIIVNKVRVKGSGKLTVNIDVTSDSNTIDYDIEVQLSGGRKGKGTTLFSVKAKLLGNQIPKFCVTINPVATPTAILPDGHGEYCSSNTDKVSIGGGDRGFRFDTDSGGKESDARFVIVSFSDYDPGFRSEPGDKFGSGQYEIDFRFVRDSVTGQQGLSLIELCVNCTGTVGISISFFAKGTKPKERGRLGYGELEDFEMDNLLAGDDLGGHSVEDCFDPDLDGVTPFVPKFNAKVTRTSPATWTIESIPDGWGLHPACVFEKTKNDSLVAKSLKNGLLMDMPFNFTLRSLP